MSSPRSRLLRRAALVAGIGFAAAAIHHLGWPHAQRPRRAPVSLPTAKEKTVERKPNVPIAPLPSKESIKTPGKKSSPWIDREGWTRTPFGRTLPNGVVRHYFSQIQQYKLPTDHLRRRNVPMWETKNWGKFDRWIESRIYPKESTKSPFVVWVEMRTPDRRSSRFIAYRRNEIDEGVFLTQRIDNQLTTPGYFPYAVYFQPVKPTRKNK